MIAFVVIGVPLPQPRHRARVQWIGGLAKKAVASVYLDEDDDIRKFKHDVRFEAGKAFHAAGNYGPHEQRALLECPLAVTLTFVFPRPKYLTWKTKPMPRAWMINVPDLDNLEKSVLDALNKVVYVDDRQVCKVNKIKVYASGDEPPRVHIAISELPPYEKDEPNAEADPSSH